MTPGMAKVVRHQGKAMASLCEHVARDSARELVQLASVEVDLGADLLVPEVMVRGFEQARGGEPLLCVEVENATRREDEEGGSDSGPGAGSLGRGGGIGRARKP